MGEIDVVSTLGPTMFNSKTFSPIKYLAIGVKYEVEENAKADSEPFDGELTEEILLKIKDSILKLKELKFETQPQKNWITKNDSEIITLTDKFFKYLKNNKTKIEAIRVSMEDYEQDFREQKLRTIKTKSVMVTADEQSINDVFDMIVKELYYEFGEKVIDLYSIILTPKIYKIVNNIPVEYRGILIRVKK